MVDFKKYTAKKTKVDTRDLNALYESLDLQASHIDPRPLQKEALKQLSAKMDDKDIVLKLSTGSGKTAIGLVYLYGQMVLRGEPVAYLVPTVQLAEQVLYESNKLGMAAYLYPATEPHPHPDCIGAKAIVVCTYDKLFNAKSTFDRNDVMLRPAAIVLDDVHAGMEKIRESFTLTIENVNLRQDIVSLLDRSMTEFSEAQWQAVVSCKPNELMEIPYWIIHSLRGELLRTLTRYESQREFLFSWPYLRDSLSLCRWIIGPRTLEITPDILPVSRVPAYFGCQHRLYLSATLADDSLLVRELDCQAKAAASPVTLKSDKGIGERMIVAPTLIDPSLNREHILQWASRMSKKHNVVVLTNRWRVAEEWEKVGAHLSKDDISLTVKRLRQHATGEFVVFAQRYDGVDLPDNACRILVMDGLPFGEGLAEQFDFSRINIPNNFTNRLIYRVEQGMGRAVRSHADYCVVVLVGPELANFISRKQVRDQMSPATKVQLELALDLAKMAKNEGRPGPTAFSDLVNQCLQRDSDWKSFYDERVRKPVQKSAILGGILPRIDFAEQERTAFNQATGNDFPSAVKTLRAALNKAGATESEAGWHLQKVARYLLHYAPAESLEVQRAAHAKNTSVSRPTGGKFRPKPTNEFSQEGEFIQWYGQFENANGPIACLQELSPRLSFSVSTNLFEESIRELGKILNAESSRPEQDFGEGPDNLWLWDSVSVVIECKTENQKRLHKKDSGQLHDSIEWFKRNYPNRGEPIPVIISNAIKPDNDAHFPSQARVMTADNLSNLVSEINNLLTDLGDFGPLSLQPELIRQKKLTRKLDSDNLILAYTKQLRP